MVGASLSLSLSLFGWLILGSDCGGFQYGHKLWGVVMECCGCGVGLFIYIFLG